MNFTSLVLWESRWHLFGMDLCVNRWPLLEVLEDGSYYHAVSSFMVQHDSLDIVLCSILGFIVSFLSWFDFRVWVSATFGIVVRND